MWSVFSLLVASEGVEDLISSVFYELIKYNRNKNL